MRPRGQGEREPVCSWRASCVEGTTIIHGVRVSSRSRDIAQINRLVASAPLITARLSRLAFIGRAPALSPTATPLSPSVYGGEVAVRSLRRTRLGYQHTPDYRATRAAPWRGRGE